MNTIFVTEEFLGNKKVIVLKMFGVKVWANTRTIAKIFVHERYIKNAIEYDNLFMVNGTNICKLFLEMLAITD